MQDVIFTPEGHQKLLNAIERARREINDAISSKGDSAAGQDGWHDEGFKIGEVSENMWRGELARLQRLEFCARVESIREQDARVDLGNGVLLKYPNGEKKAYVIDGYLVERTQGRASIGSPLGRAIDGKAVGESAIIRAPEKAPKFVVIEKIFPPSRAEEVFKEIEE
jgi:hypothetical protein